MTARLSALPLLALCLAVSSAYAQSVPAPTPTLPSAGSLLRDLEPPRASAPKADAPVVAAPSTARPKSDAPPITVTLKSVKITGSSVFTEAQLKALIPDALGRPMDLNGLEALAERITNHYRENGYTVARAYLPEQDINNGALSIAIAEGRLGAIELRDPSHVLSRGAAPIRSLKSGAVITDAALERSLLLLRDLPGVQASSTLRPGAEVGSSDLSIDVTPGPRFSGSLDADNQGSHSTGSNRLLGAASWNNPIGRGDALNLTLLSSGNGLSYGRLAYQVPVGDDGAKLGASWSTMRYRLGAEFANLNATGSATVAGLSASYPLIRSREANLSATLSYDDKRLNDRIGSVGVDTDKTARLWSLGLSGDRRDMIGGGAVSAFNATLASGRLAILSPAALAQDDASARSNGGFQKFSLTALRLQSLSEKTSLYLSYSGQWASKNLDSSEKFAVGGATGVRAYPQGEAPADRAQLITAELRHNLTPRWQLVGFVDAARATLNAEPWTGYTGASSRSLSGAGVGVNFAANGYNAKAFYAHKLGSEKATADADRSGRLWLQVSKSF